MIKDITGFKDKHKGTDIWVIGSGPSLEYINPSFFDDKITIGLNSVVERLPKIKYSCVHHFAGLEPSIKAGVPTITRTFEWWGENHKRQMIEDWGRGRPLIREAQNLFVYNHLCVIKDGWGAMTPPDGMIAVYHNATTPGMSFAEYLGAKNIILCGIDCGNIDGQENIKGYYKSLAPYAAYEEEISRMANILRIKGIGVYSLNPFINLGLEGHRFSR